MIVFGQYFPKWHDAWDPLSPVARIFVALLILLAVYELYFASLVSLRLHSLQKEPPAESLTRVLMNLHHRSINVGQMITVMFYFFGFIFFVQIQNAYWTPESNRPVGAMVLENFRSEFRFAVLMFFVFFILQCVQWIISARIRAALRRFNPSA
jgi:hypothetical protein